MADKKVIVHIGEDYVTGLVDQAFLADDEGNGFNGDAYYDAASATTLVWSKAGGAWVAWEPNVNDNIGVDATLLGSPNLTNFGPSIAFVRKLEAELGAADPLHLFKFASNATLGSDGTLGTWQKDPTASTDTVFADMLAEWVLAKADLSTDVLRVQAIIISHGRAEAADNDLTTAYEANLKQFIKDVRYLFLEDADDDPIPVIITKTGITGGNYDIIRDAQDAMASALPYVSVVEMDEDHIANATDGRSGLGNLLLGNAIYEAYQTVAVSDDLEEYNLAQLRTAIRDEFGIKATDTVQTAVMTKKLNEAMLWIAKQRTDWEWLLAEVGIDVAASRTESAATVTLGDRKVTGLTTPTKLRDIFIGGDITGSQADGYLIKSGNLSKGFRLQTKYLGASIAASTATIVKGWFKMPRNLRRAQNVELIGANNITEKMTYETNLMFDKIKRQRSHLQGIASNIKTVYTLKPDPLDKTDFIYMAVYPYPTSSRVIQINYWKTPSKLVSASDTPDLPIADRFVLLHAAFWFMATYLKEDTDRTTFYRVQALQSLEALIQNSDFGDEPDLELDNHDGGFIALPAGYPAHGNLHA
jgi:hypothetical protein